MDLLARGYAVEIVSPDTIPDNFADLELRVEADAANDLSANVAARAGEHTAFLDFVHHLKAPMEDFVRRPPKTNGTATSLPRPIDFNAEQNISGEVEAPASNNNLLAAPPSLTTVPDQQKAAQPVISPEGNPPPAKETSQRPKTGITIIFHRSRSKPKIKLKASRESGAWLWRVAAGFAVVVALSAVPIVGIRGADPLVQSAAADSQKGVPVEAASNPTPQFHQATADVAKNPPSGPQGRREDLSQASILPKTQSSGAKSKVDSSPAKVNDLAGDVTVYRDKPVSKTASRTRHHKIRHQHPDDSVAEDTVTYLDRKFTPK